MFNRTFGSPRVAFIGLIAFVALFAGLIGFSHPEAPPPLAAVTEAAKALAGGPALPPLKRYAARDGARLAYRVYPAAAPAGWAAVVVAGSGGSGAAMNRLAHALADAGVAAYSIDVRGQGASGPRGDIAYIGQLEDDLADFLKAVVRKAEPTAKLALVGHSSGGGFALRVAGEDVGKAFARYVLLSPYLGYDVPSTRPNSGGWADAAVRRIIGITFVNSLGITSFNDLPVIAFALPPARPGVDDGLTRTWSYTLWRNFGPSKPKQDAAKSAKPITLIAGADDQLMVPGAYAGMFKGVANVRVQIVPGAGHISMLGDAATFEAVIAAITGGKDG